MKALQNAGYDVISFDNGLSAYQRLREEPFELLLTDIVMPEMDGIELARRASELDPDIKIMFITGFAAVALNSDADRAEERQGAVQAGPSARPRQRSAEDAPRPEPWIVAGAFASLARLPAHLGDKTSAVCRWARSSAEEHYLDMVGVTGSIPVAPTTHSRLLPRFGDSREMPASCGLFQCVIVVSRSPVALATFFPGAVSAAEIPVPGGRKAAM